MQPRPKRKYWYKGKILHTMDILRMAQVPYDVYKKRVRRGWPLIKALATPMSTSKSPTSPPDLMYEVIPIVQGEFHRKANLIVPIDDPRTKVYERLIRTKALTSHRWKGPQGFQNFIKDMGSRPSNTTLARHNPKLPHGPNNSYWKKD